MLNSGEKALVHSLAFKEQEALLLSAPEDHVYCPKSAVLLAMAQGGPPQQCSPRWQLSCPSAQLLHQLVMLTESIQGLEVLPSSYALCNGDRNNEAS